MNHLEKLIRQYYEWRGYLVRGNVKVGRLAHGGWAGELDIVAYHPSTGHLVHIEPSLDALPWARREARFKKKFEMGRKFIHKEIFPWLGPQTSIEQLAVLATGARRYLGGGKVISVDEMMKEIKEHVAKLGIMAKSAIPQEYDLLRSVQMAICGYYRVV